MSSSSLVQILTNTIPESHNNMKTYLPTLLTFLLLVDTSVSASLKIPFKDLSKAPTRPKISKTKPEDVLEVLFEKAQEWANEKYPPKANVPPRKKDGLRIVKEYLSHYGYIADSDSFTDYMDQEMISAIKSYQTFFNLEVNGELDSKTRQHMLHPRCAVPDLDLKYNIPKSDVSWPVGTEWFPKGKKVLTYGFHSVIPANTTKVFRDSFKRWSQAIKVLNFTETTFRGADIRIGYDPSLSNMTGKPVGGTVIRLQSGSNTTKGEIHMDSTMLVGSERGVVLESVVMHQIGHVLGLNHSSVEGAVMYPSKMQGSRVELSKDDEEQIQQIYNSDGMRLTSDGIRLTSLDILSIGFAAIAMVLFH